LSENNPVACREDCYASNESDKQIKKHLINLGAYKT